MPSVPFGAGRVGHWPLGIQYIAASYFGDPAAFAARYGYTLTSQERRDLLSFLIDGWVPTLSEDSTFLLRRANEFISLGRTEPEPSKSSRLQGLYSRLIVRFRAGVSEQSVKRLFGEMNLRIVRELKFAFSRWGCRQWLFEVRLEPRRGERIEAAVQRVARALRRRVLKVAWVESHIIAPIHRPEEQYTWAALEAAVDEGACSPHPPDDWHWRRTLVTKARKSGKGKGIRVGVIDRDFEFAHEALGHPGLAGAHFNEADELEVSPIPRPQEPHGTLCAGLVGSRTVASFGGGAAPEASLTLVALRLRVVSQLLIARAIAFCCDPSTEPAQGASGAQPVDLLSISLGLSSSGWKTTRVLDTALRFAVRRGRRNGRHSLGVAVFWAAFNDPAPTTADAVIRHPMTVSVAATDCMDDFRSGYNGGIDFLAPGLGVGGPVIGGYRTGPGGASFAAACAAGIAALALEASPRLRWRDLKRAMLEGCEFLGTDPSAKGDQGAGLINAVKAIGAAKRKA